MRLALAVSHPIQYMCPWFRALAAAPEIDLTVLFFSDHAQKPSHDPGFNATFQWDRPLTEGYRHEFLRNIHPRGGPFGFFHQVNPGLWSRLRADRFDAMMVFGWGLASSWIAVAAARAHRVPILLHSESNLVPWQRAAWKEPIRRAVLRALFSQVAAVLAIGSRSARLFEAHGVPRERVFLAPYAVDNDFFLAERALHTPRRDEHRRALGITDERPVLVVSGKLIPRKAPLDALRAFARVRASRPTTLIYLGDGPLRADVEAEARRLGVDRDVVITGFRNQREMAPVYVASDVFVFPSHYDTWGLVLNEGLLFGLPAVCSTAIGATDDLIERGHSGELFAPGDWQGLADVLDRLLADPARRRTMGGLGFEKIRTWTFARGVEATVDALRSVRNRVRG